jgi:hypothetical protein
MYQQEEKSITHTKNVNITVTIRRKTNNTY